jgi:hypothetical protein
MLGPVGPRNCGELAFLAESMASTRTRRDLAACHCQPVLRQVNARHRCGRRSGLLRG